MKKRKRFLFAGILGLVVVVGIIALRELNLCEQADQDDYTDTHRHFDFHTDDEDHHGVEFLAMR